MTPTTIVYRATHGVIDGAWVDAPWVEVDDEGMIVRTGDAKTRPHAAAPEGIVRDLGPVMLLPGLVNAHSHAFQRAIRGSTHHRGADDPSSFWSWRDAMYRTATTLDPPGVYAITRQAYTEMLRAGITCVGEFHYLHHQPQGQPYSDPNEMSWQVRRAAEDVGIRLVLLEVLYLRGGPARPPAPEQLRFCDADADAYLARIDPLRTHGVELGLAPHSVRAVDRPSLESVAQYAHQYALPLHIHLSEQPRENLECQAEHGMSPTELLDHTGMLARPGGLTAVHAVHTSDSDRHRLGGQQACICPSTEADLGDGIAPAVDLRKANVELALGSDSNAVIDLIQEARLLEMHERLRGQARLRLSDDGGGLGLGLLRIATEGGASALGRSDRSGRLSVGRPFDAITLSIDDPWFEGIAAQHRLDALLCSGTAAAVRHVFVGGIERHG